VCRSSCKAVAQAYAPTCCWEEAARTAAPTPLWKTVESLIACRLLQAPIGCAVVLLRIDDGCASEEGVWKGVKDVQVCNSVLGSAAGRHLADARLAAVLSLKAPHKVAF
jgi:hypothetical protein